MRCVPVAGLLLLGMPGALQAGPHGRESHERLAISQLVLVSSRDVDKHLVEEVYRGELTHSGAQGSGDFAGVTVALINWLGLAHPSLLQILDGQWEFGSVRAGGMVESRDTITIRRLRYLPLKLKHLRWRISARPDLVLPEPWAGTWRFTIVTKDAETGDTISVDDITDTIGRHEPVGFSMMTPFVRCEWAGTDDFLEASCRSRIKLQGCVADGTATFTVERNDGTLEGQGQWDLTLTGDCGQTSGGGAAMVMTAVRLSREAPTERFSAGVLTKLATSPALAALLAGQASNEGQR